MTEETTSIRPPTLEEVYDVMYHVFPKYRELINKHIKTVVLIRKTDPFADHMSTLGVDARGKIFINEEFWEKLQEMHEEDYDGQVENNGLSTVLAHEMLHHIGTECYDNLTFDKDDPFISLKAAAVNIAADARINAYIYHNYEDKVYADFFQKFYTQTEELEQNPLFMLLRPEAEFPDTEKEADLKKVHMYLYSIYKSGQQFLNYRKIYEIVLDYLLYDATEEQKEMVKSGKYYIGNHGKLDPNDPNQQGTQDGQKFEQAKEGEEDKDEGEKLRHEISEGEASPGAGPGGNSTEYLIKEYRGIAPTMNPKIFKLMSFNDSVKNIRGEMTPDRSVITSSPVLPQKIYRSDLVMLAAGFDPVIWKTPTPIPSQDKKNCPIYLDISGSMWRELPKVISMILTIRDDVDFVWGFSTEIHKHTLDDLAKGHIKGTGGTNFQCIVDHALENDYRNIAVISDGDGSIQKEYSDYSYSEKIPGIDSVLMVLVGTWLREDNYFARAYKNQKGIEELLV